MAKDEPSPLYGPDDKPVERPPTKEEERKLLLSRGFLQVCVFCSTPFGINAKANSRRATGERSRMEPLRYTLDFRRTKFYYHETCRSAVQTIVEEGKTE